MQSKKYCFIVNTYGRDFEVVKKCLNSIIKQMDDQCSLFFINQNEEEVKGKEIDDKVRVINKNVKSISKARNIALEISHAKWFVFVDDDAEISSNYVVNLKHITSKLKNIDLFSGTIKNNKNTNEYYSRRQSRSGQVKTFLHTKKIMGGNIIIKSDTFKEVNGFDEQFGVGGVWPSGEDTDLAWNLYFRKKNIALSKELVIYHPPPSLINIEKAYLYGLGKGALSRKWLLKGHLIVFLEVIEMILVPIVKSIFTLKIKPNFLTISGRIKGFITYKENR